MPLRLPTRFRDPDAAWRRAYFEAAAKSEVNPLAVPVVARFLVGLCLGILIFGAIASAILPH